MLNFRFNHMLVLGMALALGTSSCSKDSDKNTPIQSEVTLKLCTGTSIQSKTWLDTNSGMPIMPVYWSDGDQVVVNGVTSSPLSVPSGTKLNSAEFSVRNVEAPYSLLYPAGAFKSSDENGIISFTIPNTQEYVPDSFGSGAAIMYGRSDSDDRAVMLQNICGAVSVILSDPEAVITSVTLTSLGSTPVAGEFTIDMVNDVLEAVSGSNEVRMVLPEGGVKLGAEGTRFVFTIPAGDYPEGFRLRFDDSSKHILRNYWLRPEKEAEAGISVESGHIVCFEAMAYDPDAREIMNADDWAEFATAYAAGNWQEDWLGKDGSIKIGADFTTTELKPLNEFADVLDGQGFTITQTSAKLPVFGELTGTVRNLTLAGKMSEPSSPGDAGATVFAKSMSGSAAIQNCVNKCEISVSGYNGKLVAAAFVRTLMGGSISGCTNEAPIKISSDLTSSSQAVLAGGFAGTVNAMNAPATITDCKNEGDINVMILKPAAIANCPAQAGYGGIVGTVVSGDATNFLSMENCINDGAISVNYSQPNTGGVNSMSGIGGLVGTAVKYNSTGKTQSYYTRLPESVANEDGVHMTMNGCINNGNLSNGMVCSVSSDDPFKSFCGGLAGVLNGTEASHITVTRCENYGSVTGCESAYSRTALCVVTGGLCGFGGYVDFDKCKVVSKQIGSIKRQAYSAAIGIGYAMMNFTLTDCDLFADVQHIRCTNYSEGNYAIAFNLSTKQNSAGGIWWPFIKIGGSRVSGCRVGGSFILSKDVVAYNAATPSVTETTQITASNLSKFLASPSFNADYYGKGFPSMVTIDGNSYWNGK